MSELDIQLKRFQQINSTINDIFSFDPHLLFSDTFERINQQLSGITDLISQINPHHPNYYVVYNIVNSVIPFIERIVFAGYADQILEFSLTLYQAIASNLMFCTSRFVPFRLQLFLTVSAVYANTEESREKDADLFIQTFKTEMMNMKELEESNINGLSEAIIACNNQKIVLQDLYSTVFTSIELIHAHFSTSDEIIFDKIGSSRKQKRKGARPTKDEPAVHPISQPSVHTVHMIINSFNSPMAKAEYLSKYSQVIQSWTVPECEIAPILLHRLVYCFMRTGSLDGLDAVNVARPEDKIMKLALSLSTEQWAEASEIISQLTKEEIAVDFQFYNQYALKIWNRFAAGKISDPIVLKGVLHIFIVSPSPCPIETSLTALQYAWHLDSQKMYEESYKAAESALIVLESYRDYFSIRKTQKILSTSPSFPNKPLDQGYLLFERWLECLHVDLFTIYFRAKLNFGLVNDIKQAKIDYEAFIEKTKKEKIKEEQLYGSLDAAQKQKYNNLLNKPFSPPKKSNQTENMLLEQFKHNYGAKALIYIEMAFFNHKQAPKLLAKARETLNEFSNIELPSNSPLIFSNRYQISLLCPNSIPEAKTISLFGKETIGSMGITTANTALKGTGEKHDKTEPFLITDLKPNTLYTFAFGAYDSHDELIDNLLPPFSITTCHSLAIELVWSYLASASYSLKNNESFDFSLTYLMKRFTEVDVVSDEHKFFSNCNPFHRFVLKPSTLSLPAPILRSFASALVMAGRLFASKPLHAASFQKIALILSQVLESQKLTLSICHEMLATIQPNLIHTFHSKWVLHPLLFIINALMKNKKTVNKELHQEILSRASYAINSLFIWFYQERQLSQFILGAVQSLPPNKFRSFFLLFASKNQILETSTGDSTLLLAAADCFRNSPERAFDDIFNKFKADPLFCQAAIYVISAAHNVGLCTQGANWANTCLEYIKSQLHESEEKAPTKKTNARNQKAAKPKKATPTKGKDKNQAIDPSKPPEENEIEQHAAVKIQAMWNHYRNRTKNNAKYYEANKHRAALCYLHGMCLVENDSSVVTSVQQTDRTTTSRKHAKPKAKASSKKVEDDSVNPDQYLIVMNAFRHAIVFAERSNEQKIILNALRMLEVVLAEINPNLQAFASIAAIMSSFVDVIIQYAPMSEIWAIKTLKACLLILLNDNKSDIVALLLDKASTKSTNIAELQWMIGDKEPGDDLKNAIEVLNRRDSAENVFFSADLILQKAHPIVMPLFPEDPANIGIDSLMKSVGTIAISLQHKQKLSMSVSLLTRLAFILFARNQTDLAVTKLCEALEGHFRVVKAHEKVIQILEKETEETFYQSHSWSGCISIAVISTFIAMYSKKNTAMMLSKLAAFSLASVFSSNHNNPTKAIDFIEFEPPELVNGVDVFASFDANQPLLEPINVEYVTIALNHLLSSLFSYEMYFEMFKPLSFARHFFRFITRQKRHLTRARLMTIMSCCEFGLMKGAMTVFNDIITHFGESRTTSETVLYSPNAKRIPFSVSDPAYSPGNQDAIKQLSSSISQIATDYGSALSFQFAICVSKFCIVAAEAVDPLGAPTNEVPAETPKDGSISSRGGGKHKKSHSHSKSKGGNNNDQDNANSAFSSPSSDFYTSVLRIGENLLNDCISKEVRNVHKSLKWELQIVKALIYLKQFRWDLAIKTAEEVLKNLSANNEGEMALNNTDQTLLLINGIISTAKSVIYQASYNVNDFRSSEEFASSYYKSLILIRKADFEGAVKILSQICQLKPLTMFHREYILSVAQFITLICFEPRLNTSKLNVVEIITTLKEKTQKFFIEEIGMKEAQSQFIRNIFLLVRLIHLEAISNMIFCGPNDPTALLNNANNLMRSHCPYISHGLSFLLNSSISRIQMQLFLRDNPLCLLSWNKEEVSPLQRTFSQDFIDKSIELTTTMFQQAPDCAIVPSSNECIVNLVLLSGLTTNLPTDEKKFLNVKSALVSASSIHSAQRLIQSMISQVNDTAPMNCPSLLMNDNKDQTLRGLANAYYAHTCSLELPFFDTELLEYRTYFFFKCFEDKLSSFKISNKETLVQGIEPGTVLGQWYPVDASLFKNNEMVADGQATTTVARSSRSLSTRSSISSASTLSPGKKKGSGALRGVIMFFLGIVIDVDESVKKKSTAKTSSQNLQTNALMHEFPIIVAAQNSEISNICAEMAEIGLNLDEATHLESAEEGEAPPSQANNPAGNDGGGKRKRQSQKQAKQEVVNVSLLKNQAEVIRKSSEIQWGVSLHKVENIFNKSNRIVNSISEAKNRWPNEVKIGGIEIGSAYALSHFFNCQFGVNEKTQQLVDWLQTFMSQSTV